MDDVIYVWKIEVEDEIDLKENLLNRKIKTTSDLTKIEIKKSNENKKDMVASENMLNFNTKNATIDECDDNKKMKNISNNDVNYIDSLSLIMQWSYQCNSKYLNGVKFFRHLNCDDFNTDDNHKNKYIAVVAYDYSEINIYSISYR